MGKSVRTIQGSDQQVVAAIKEIAQSDKKSESTRNMGCGAMMLGGLLFVAPVMMDASMADWIWIVAGVLFVAGIVLYFVGQSGDVDDSRYQALLRLHRFLVGDCAESTDYHYVLDLRPYTHRAFYSHADKFGSFFSLPSGKHEHFDCPVIYGQVKLRDGTALSVNVNRLTRKTTKTKRSRSGKRKTKYKYKYGTRFEFKAKLPDESAPNQCRGNPPLHRGKPPKYKADGNKLAARTVEKNTGQELEVDGLLKLLVFTFRQVRQQRQSA